MPRLGTVSPPSATFSLGLQTAKPCARLPHDSTARLAPEIHRAEDSGDISAAMREEIRNVILEELRDLFMGS